jgi:glycosyltransferase involved in cell wall biosynthesis
VRDGINGYLVPPSDALALATAIQKLLKSPSKRLEMGQTGRQIIEKEFSFSSIAAKVSEVYKEAMC